MLAAIYAPALNLATNPNTPTEVLLNLGAEFPEQLLDNPVFFLLLLENLNLVEQMPVTTLQSILKQERVPVPFLEWAASHSNRDVLVAVAQKPNTPGDSLGKLARAKDPTVRQSVAQNPNTHCWQRHKTCI